MRCPQCQKRVSKNEDRCPFCGERIVDAPQPQNDVSSTRNKNFVTKSIRRYSLYKLVVYGVPLIAWDTLLILSVIANGMSDLSEIGWVNGFVILVPNLCLIPLIVFHLYRLFAPRRHPVFRRLSSYGTPRQICALIDEELDSGAQIGSKDLETPNFFILRSHGSLDIVAHQDIIWIYIDRRYKFNHVFFIFFYVKIFHDIVAVDYKRRRHTFRFKNQNETSNFADEIMSRLPFVITNMNQENKKLVREEAEDIHRYILQRRFELMREQEAEAAGEEESEQADEPANT